LGGKRFLLTGLGDDQHPDKYETEWEEWNPELYNHIEADPPPTELPPSSHIVKIHPAKEAKEKNIAPTVDRFLPSGAQFVKLDKVKL